MTLTETPNATKIAVGMGQIFLAREPTLLTSVLGSCVGVALYHPRERIAALAHVVLPDSAGRPGTPGKFADTAVPELLFLLGAEGIDICGLQACLAGGSNMFGSVAKQLQIGELNLAACRAALARHRLPLRAEHVGGNQGRRVTLTPLTGALTVEIAGQSPFTI